MVDCTPDPNLLESMRSVGYSLNTAVADIIDNSIAAHAKTISIRYFDHGEFEGPVFVTLPPASSIISAEVDLPPYISKSPESTNLLPLKTGVMQFDTGFLSILAAHRNLAPFSSPTTASSEIPPRSFAI